ncbi:TPA: tail fiber assembly protein [Escherichia coli]|nr:tail fiber assembly protein [Escherichia coli]
MSSQIKHSPGNPGRFTEQQKANLIAEASQTISILQDAVDLDMATDEERTQLTTLKKYRVLLSRVDTSKAPDIDWPK